MKAFSISFVLRDTKCPTEALSSEVRHTWLINQLPKQTLGVDGSCLEGYKEFRLFVIVDNFLIEPVLRNDSEE